MTDFAEARPNEGIVQQAVGPFVQRAAAQMDWAALPDIGFVQEALVRLNDEKRS